MTDHTPVPPFSEPNSTHDGIPSRENWEQDLIRACKEIRSRKKYGMIAVLWDGLAFRIMEGVPRGRIAP